MRSYARKQQLLIRSEHHQEHAILAARIANVQSAAPAAAIRISSDSGVGVSDRLSINTVPLTARTGELLVSSPRSPVRVVHGSAPPGATQSAEDELPPVHYEPTGARRSCATGEWKSIALATVLFAITELSGKTFVFEFAPRIFMSWNVVDNFYFYCIITAFQFVFAAGSATIVDRVGRRPILILGSIVMAASMLSLAFYVSTLDNSYLDIFTHDVSQNDHRVGLALACLFLCAHSMSWGSVGLVVACELVPLQWHEAGLAIIFFVKWSCKGLFLIPVGATCGGIRLQTTGSLRMTLCIFGLVCLFAGALVGALLPETAGRALEETCAAPLAWWEDPHAAAVRHLRDRCEQIAPADTQPDTEAALESSFRSSSSETVLRNAALSPFSTPLLAGRNVVMLDGGVRGKIGRFFSGLRRRLSTCFGRSCRAFRPYAELLSRLRLHSRLLDRSVRLVANEEQSMLALLCAVDVWAGCGSLFYAFIVLYRLPGDNDFPALQNCTPEAGSGEDNMTRVDQDATKWGDHLGPATFQCLFFGILIAYLAVIRLAVLANFFTRDWSLVLFLYKLFELGQLLIMAGLDIGTSIVARGVGRHVVLQLVGIPMTSHSSREPCVQCV